MDPGENSQDGTFGVEGKQLSHLKRGRSRRFFQTDRSSIIIIILLKTSNVSWSSVVDMERKDDREREGDRKRRRCKIGEKMNSR